MSAELAGDAGRLRREVDAHTNTLVAVSEAVGGGRRGGDWTLVNYQDSVRRQRVLEERQRALEARVAAVEDVLLAQLDACVAEITRLSRMGRTLHHDAAPPVAHLFASFESMSDAPAVVGARAPPRHPPGWARATAESFTE